MWTFDDVVFWFWIIIVPVIMLPFSLATTRTIIGFVFKSIWLTSLIYFMVLAPWIVDWVVNREIGKY